jgi:nucleotide-binding universal stress UspA family protein
MTALVWLVEDTWQACIDAARTCVGTDEVVLLHVTEEAAVAAAQGARAGLLGRSHSPHAPETRIQTFARIAAEQLLTAAADRFGRPARLQRRTGRVKHEVVAACAHVDLLILARDGDLRRRGPKSLGPTARFVVDHAPCPVLLIWPSSPPALGSTPPHPPRRHR